MTAKKTTRKARTVTKRTTSSASRQQARGASSKQPANDYVKLDTLPFTETKDFAVVLESYANPSLPSGWDWQYALINKQTGVIEARLNVLTLSIVLLQNTQQMYDKMLVGEINGYHRAPVEVPTESGL
jgi:hypothetical protein